MIGKLLVEYHADSERTVKWHQRRRAYSCCLCLYLTSCFSIKIDSGFEIHHCHHWCGYEHVPSVLWRCWLGGRKGIRTVKIGGEILAWLSV